MGFKNRISSNTNRRKLFVESVETDAGGNIKSIIITGIQRMDGNIVEIGTKLDEKDFAKALYDIQTNGLNLAYLVDIENSDTRYYQFKAQVQQNFSMVFNYTGPKISANIEESAFFSTNLITENDKITINFNKLSTIDQLTQITNDEINVSFYVIETSAPVKNTMLTIVIVPPTVNPND